MPDYIQIANWDKFQAYKHRRPPWIRVYNDLLERLAWRALPDESKALLVSLWLLASRLDNRIPADAGISRASAACAKRPTCNPW